MKRVLLILTLIFAFSNVFAGNGNEVVEFKSKIGFINNEDKIANHEFLENGKKILIIGQKNLQLWDVENTKLLISVPHQIGQFAPSSFVTTYLLLGIPRILNWRPFLVDPQGKWIITIEKVGTNPARSAIVRNLQDLKQIAVLDLPAVSTDYVALDDNKNELLTFGTSFKNAAFATWDKEKFTSKDIVSVQEYKWHQKIRDDRKILVGSGDTKTAWTGINSKQGDTLTLRDVKTGAIEKEFTAKNLKPETSYQETTVSADEKYLIAKRTDRIFVWDIDGDGSPRFEVSNPDPKGSFSFKEIRDMKYIVVKVDEQLRVYDIAGNGTPMLAVSPQNPKEDLDFVKIVKDRFILVYADGKLRVYDSQGSAALKFEIVSDTPEDSIYFCGATGDGKYIAVRDDRKVSVFELSGDGKPLYEIVRQSEKERFPTVKIIEDKNLLVVARVNRSEKKEPKTEFYEIKSGKLAFDAAFAAGYDLRFTPDGKYVYQTELGSFSVWNIAARRLLFIPLDVYYPETDPSKNPAAYWERSENTEYADFSPDYRYILRHGDDVTEVYETESGNVVKTLFDPAKVKYNKQNKVKKSGLGEAGWVKNGKYVFAFEPENMLSSTNTVSFWEVKK